MKATVPIDVIRRDLALGVRVPEATLLRYRQRGVDEGCDVVVGLVDRALERKRKNKGVAFNKHSPKMANWWID